MSLQRLNFGTGGNNDGEVLRTAFPKLDANDAYLDGRITALETVGVEADQYAVNLSRFGAAGDGTTDDTLAVTNWLHECSQLATKGFAGPGNYLISYIDEVFTGNLDIECSTDAVFKGAVSYQDFAGDDVTTTHVITDFDFYDAGVVLEIIDTGTLLVTDRLVEDADYTIAGASINLAAGASPHGAVAAGSKLRVTATKPIMTLRRSGSAARLNWVGGRFDCSERGYSEALPTGSALSCIGWARGTCENVDFIGAADWEEARAERISDSGLGITECTNFTARGCYFQGWGDLGIYATGNADSGPADNGGNLSFYANVFYRCTAGLKAVRQIERVSIVKNFFIECATGVLNGLTGTPALDSGTDYILAHNYFKKCGRRAIDLRAMVRGATIIGNRIEDIGFMLDGTTPYVLENGSTDTNPTAIVLAGCATAIVHDNRLGFRDWPATNNQRAFQIYATTFADASVAYADALSVHDNYVQGFPFGIVETGTAENIRYCRYDNNTMDGVATMHVVLSSTTTFSYFDPATGLRWRGVGTASVWRDDQFMLLNGAADPTLRLAEGNSATAFTELTDVAAGQGRLRKTAATNPFLDIESVPLDGTSTATARFFRNSTTSGSGNVDVNVPGTTTVNARVAGRGESYAAANNGNFGIKSTAAGASAVGVLHMGAGTAPTVAPADKAQIWVEDIAGGSGKAGHHMMAESGTGKLIVGGILRKTDAGDPSQVHEGLFCINEADNTFKVYADGGWRQLGTW